MYNRSEFQANQFLAQTVKRHNFKVSKNETTISTAAWFVLIFGAIGFLLSIAYFAN
jgi:hypothetical protein